MVRYPRYRLTRWLKSFAPLPVSIRWPERFRSCLGALLGISFTGGLMHLFTGDAGPIPYLIAPMGASAVLLFAVPASPLAQPWSIVGGNLVSAIVGVACARWIPNPLDAAPLAVALAVGAMFALRCVHPPSGAVALTAVLGGPAVHALGFGFVLAPVAVQSFALLGLAIVFHAATGHRYPHAARSADKQAGERPAVTSPGFTRADLEAVLGRRNELLDVNPDDLEVLLREIQLQSYARTFSGLTCGDIMSRPALAVTRDTLAAEAAAMMREHNIKALPVIDPRGSVVGIVTRADTAKVLDARGARAFLARIERWFAVPGAAARTVASVMTEEVETVDVSRSIAELVPIFAATGHHHIPVVDSRGRIAGMITQADLILGLYEEAHAEAERAQ